MNTVSILGHFSTICMKGLNFMVNSHLWFRRGFYEKCFKKVHDGVIIASGYPSF